MNNEQIQDLALEALNAAALVIQDRLGITSGDVAGLFFSGGEVQDILAAYIRTEINYSKAEA